VNQYLRMKLHAASGWRIHCGVKVTELSTNKQHSLSLRMKLMIMGMKQNITYETNTHGYDTFGMRFHTKTIQFHTS
jgi:hypothetical protein